MGRAFSWSLAAHALFIISFLLLSATRQPLTIPQVARPVRLVTYLEPSAAPRSRAAPPADAEPARAAPAVAAPRPPQPAVPPPRPAAAAPTAVQRVVIPVRGAESRLSRASRTPPAPAPAAEMRPALSERLARRLATTAPAESRPAAIAAPPIAAPQIAAPQIARLPTPETTAAPPLTDRTPPGAPATESVVPVGYFPHAWYLAVLKERVFARWSPPSEFFRSSRPPAALVSFRIDRSGGLGEITLKTGSGSARFDKSALAAIQGLGRLPPLPEQYREETLDVVIRFQNEQ